MSKENPNTKMYPITSVCKEDIKQAFKDVENDELRLAFIDKRIEKMEDYQMEYLAKKMADDYCNQMFWDSLRIIFEDRFFEDED